MEGRLYMWLLCALPGSVTEVCKSHVACSQLIKLSQSSQTAVNGVTSLYSNQRGNMTGCCCWHNVIGGGCKLEDLGVLLDKALDDIHLVNESARSISELCVAGHVGRPELGGGGGEMVHEWMPIGSSAPKLTPAWEPAIERQMQYYSITYLSSHSPCPQPGYVCLPLISICTIAGCIQCYLVKLALEVGSDLVGKVIVASWERGCGWGEGGMGRRKAIKAR